MKCVLVLLFAGFSAVGAGAQTFGDWQVGQGSDGGAYMTVTNESGGVLGSYCSSKDGYCRWAIATKTSCEVGAQGPILINTGRAALSSQATCLGELKLTEGTFYQSVIHDYDSFETAVNQSENIAIATAVEGGQFRITRFRMRGTSSASVRFKALIEKMPPSTSTKDQTL